MRTHDETTDAEHATVRRLIGLLIVLAAVSAAAAAVAFWYERVRAPFKGYESAEQFVEIPPGRSPQEIGEQLVQAGVVRDWWTFRAALWQSGDARRLKAGEYRFDHALTPEDVVQKIVRGEVYRRPLTFPEGLTIKEMALIYESRGFGPASAFEAAARDPAPIATLDAAARDLEGYLFPETYLLPRRTPAPELIRQMVERFAAAFPESLRQEAAATGRSIHDIVSLAALVEKETARADERPLVAAVYTNRLRIGMPLQCDPTVIYALLRAGLYNGNLTHDALGIDSPYNTYKYAGLPPGPIAAPGRLSLEAAVRPASVDYLYFVSRNDGSHVFARTLAEHNRNVHEYQILYFREKRRQAANP